jgi:predicted dehydrogenase
VQTEDFGAVLFRMGEHARGAMTASQVSVGRRNYLNIEIYGTKSSVQWNQERPVERPVSCGSGTATSRTRGSSKPRHS